MRGVDSRSPEQAYVSKGNIGFPGTATQATNAEARARDQHSNQGETEDGGAALSVDSTFNRVQTDSIEAAR